jgi:hypothetical protein
LTDEEAGQQATRVIDVALALNRGVPDTELFRRWQLSRAQAVALLYKRQRHPKVVAFIGDSLDALHPKKKLLEGVARLAISLVEADEARKLTGAAGEKPRITMTAAIRLAAQRVRVAGFKDGIADPTTGIPKRIAQWGEVDAAGVKREVRRIMRGESD